MIDKKKEFGYLVTGQPVLVMIINLLLVALLFTASRLVFYFANSSFYADMTAGHLLDLCVAGLGFDRTAIIYTNALVLLLCCLPLKVRNTGAYQTCVKIVFVLFNSIALVADLADVAFFQFTNRRTTFSIFSEFNGEGNMGKVLAESLIRYWYLTLFAIFCIWLLWRLFLRAENRRSLTEPVVYYPIHTAIMLVVMGLAVAGARGGFTRDTRPITLSNANAYINHGTEAGIVLNTPFCIYRTIGHKTFRDPHYFAKAEDAERLFNPVVVPNPSGSFKPLNVVVLILESFSKEHSGFFNQGLEGGAYKGFTPFLDSLYQQGYTFHRSYATGRKSIDAMPSILSSIPAYEEPFILTGYSNNRITSLASILGAEGYTTAFFHGAPNGSMGFDAYARSAGFQSYYGMTEYGNDADFDGWWAIWDEPFLQYFAKTMGTLKEPFMTAVFTASSHHPFHVPEQYIQQLPEGRVPLSRCVAYTDMALRKFFATASQMPWYNNTLFVVTADHTSQVAHDEYRTDEKLYSVPILFYQPGNDSLRGISNNLICQADIMPSVLAYLNYGKPYFAFGHDALVCQDSSAMVVNYNKPLYQVLQGDLMLQFDEQNAVSAYNVKDDPLLRKNILDPRQGQQQSMLNYLKAHIQLYMQRMLNNNLYVLPKDTAGRRPETSASSPLIASEGTDQQQAKEKDIDKGKGSQDALANLPAESRQRVRAEAGAAKDDAKAADSASEAEPANTKPEN